MIIRNPTQQQRVNIAKEDLEASPIQGKKKKRKRQRDKEKDREGEL